MPDLISCHGCGHDWTPRAILESDRQGFAVTGKRLTTCPRCPAKVLPFDPAAEAMMNHEAMEGREVIVLEARRG